MSTLPLKKPRKNLSGVISFMVPRDRIFIAFDDFNRRGCSIAPAAPKLPTRGFSDQHFLKFKNVVITKI
jgi:hypothetical protein